MLDMVAAARKAARYMVRSMLRRCRGRRGFSSPSSLSLTSCAFTSAWLACAVVDTLAAAHACIQEAQSAARTQIFAWRSPAPAELHIAAVPGFQATT